MAAKIPGNGVESSGAFTIGAAGTASSLAGIPFYNGDTTSIYTHDVSGTDDTASNNTAYGIAALDAVTQADNAVCIGYNAGTAMTTGGNNTIMGSQAGEALTSGGSNMFIGRQAGDGQDTENHNVGIGRNALGGAINGGEYNTAIGNNTLDACTSGDYNVAVGYDAGTTMTSTTGNTLIGYEAGRAQNYDGAAYVTMVGYQAGEDQTTSAYNTGFGAFNQRASDTENHNTSIGYYSMQGANGGGEYNTALGSYVLSNSSQSGDYNVGVGWRALYAATSGDRNVTMGYQAGDGITSGDGNIFIGYDSTLGSVSTASGNISIGDQNQHSNGNYEITIGYQIQGLGGNSVTIGSPSGKVYNVFSLNNTWVQTSDERAKNIIGTNNVGLDFINECRVVDFTWKPNNELPTTFNEHREENYKDTTTVCNGFIAQEVKSALEKVGVDPEKYGVWDEQLDGVQSVSREMFILPLVNAVKELSAKVKALEEA